MPELIAILKQALEWFKKPTHYFIPLLVVSVFGLFAPISVLKSIGIGSWRTDGKLYLGSIFVVSSAVLICHYARFAINWFVEKYKFHSLLRAGHSRLKFLTIEEQEILAMYLQAKSKTQMLNPMSGVVTGLRQSNIIYSAADESCGNLFPFNIRNWAWIYINKNPHIVGLELSDHKG